jgi:hypothetical protein
MHGIVVFFDHNQAIIGLRLMHGIIFLFLLQGLMILMPALLLLRDYIKITTFDNLTGRNFPIPPLQMSHLIGLYRGGALHLDLLTIDDILKTMLLYHLIIL